jgi:transposase
MLRPRGRQGSFYDTEHVCERLIPPDSFYRKFRETVWPLIEDEQFETMYCGDNGRPAIPPSLLAMAAILQFYKDLSDREMERACMYDIEVKYALGLRLDERPFDPLVHRRLQEAAP